MRPPRGIATLVARARASRGSCDARLNSELSLCKRAGGSGAGSVGERNCLIGAGAAVMARVSGAGPCPPKLRIRIPVNASECALSANVSISSHVGIARRNAGQIGAGMSPSGHAAVISSRRRSRAAEWPPPREGARKWRRPGRAPSRCSPRPGRRCGVGRCFLRGLCPWGLLRPWWACPVGGPARWVGLPGGWAYS